MEQKSKSIKHKRDYKVPIGLFWKVITEREHMKQWYMDFSANFILETGQQFDWWAGPPDGKQWLHRGKIIEIIPGKKLVHSWEYPGYTGRTIVSWELSEIDELNTQLDFSQLFEIPFDPNEEALRMENFKEGWNSILNVSLVEYFNKIQSVNPYSGSE